MKNINTKFPSQIDDRVFAMDISIDQVSIMNQYYTLLNNGAYSKASELLNNSDVFFYGAWCLNLLENRLYAIGNYVINLEGVDSIVNSESEPSTTELDNNISWIGGNE